MNLRSLLLIILLAALLAAPSAMAQPGEGQREAIYQRNIDDLPSMQNSDGGFGLVTQVPTGDGNTTNVTEDVHDSFIQTVLTVHLLVLEETDRLETWENHEGVSTSLARSNATSAWDWLRTYEKNHENQFTPGDDALLSLAYHDLGDHENARELLSAVLDEEADDGSHMGAVDLAQALFVQERAGFALNETQNATLAKMDDRLSGMQLDAPGPLSWALLAQPDDGDRRAQLVNRLDSGVSVSLSALGAWALAQSGGADVVTEDQILAVHQWDPDLQTIARTYMLLAERTANPHFSEHVSLVEDRSVRGVGANVEPSESGSTPQEETRAPPPASDPAPGDDGPEPATSFPLPAWLMMGILVVALAVLVVSGLAYGLKREDLDGPRKEIFNYIDEHPGEHFSKIRRDLNLAPGTFQHHLSVLESGGWITSYKDSRYKRYFVNGNRYKQMIAGYQYKQKFAALANGTTRDLVQFIHEHPGVTQKEVALRLNLHASTVNWHANRLKQAGILNPQRVGREVRYHVDVDEVKKMLLHANN